MCGFLIYTFFPLIAPPVLMIILPCLSFGVIGMEQVMDATIAMLKWV